MTSYCWNSAERKFTRTKVQHQPRSQEAKRLRVAKGERTAREVATGDLTIQLLEGAWRMEIANHELTVQHGEAVVIPSGFSHSAEAIEDSFAVQMVDERDQIEDASLWAV